MSSTEVSQETMDAAKAFYRLARYDPVKFQRQILGITVDPWQEEATEAVFDVVRKRYGRKTKLNHQGKNFFTVRAMHGPGKTFWLGSLITTFGFAFPKARIPCIAPKMDQLKTRLWLELRKIADGIKLPAIRAALNIQATTMKFFDMDDWLAFAQTATKAENLAGLHHDFQLVCVDEASGVPEALWPTIFGAVNSGKVVILVLISNPTKNTGTFAESWLREAVAKDFWQIAITLDKAPRVPKEWVAKMARKYGESSPIFKIRCLGEFADSGANQLIPLQWILDSFVDEPCAGDGSTPRLRVSIDIADGGEDETVITVLRRWNTFEELMCMRRFSFEAGVAPLRAAEAAIEMFKGWGGDKGEDDFVADGMGVGAGTVGKLSDEGYNVVRYAGGAASDNPKKWRNRRVQSYTNLRDAFREGKLKVRRSAFESDEDVEDFQAQLCLIERKPGDEKVEDLVTKREMMQKGIKSPDIADSLAMGYATQMPLYGSRAVAEEARSPEDLMTVVPVTWNREFYNP